jgi:hypothetical protein
MRKINRSYSWCLSLMISLCIVSFTRQPISAAEIIHEQVGQVADFETWLINRYEHAQDFVLTSPSKLTRITAWLAEARNPGTNDGVFDGFTGLSWGLYTDNSGQPGALITFGFDPNPAKTDTSLVFAFGGDIFRVDTSLDSAILSPARYWVTLHSGDWQIPNESLIGWSTTLTDGFGIAHFSDDLTVPGKTWVGPLSEQAFVLYGERVPEPSGIALLAAITFALVIVGRF